MGDPTRVFGYLRTSTTKQDLDNQRLAILAFANSKALVVNEFVQVQVSTRRRRSVEEVKKLREMMSAGDLLIISELSRLARSMDQLIVTVKALRDDRVRLISIKENLDLDPSKENDIQSTIILGLFGILYEVERSLISERTKMGLARAKASGKKLGRPKGVIGKSLLDEHIEDIKAYRSAGVSMSAIARLLKCHVSTVKHFLVTRGID